MMRHFAVFTFLVVVVWATVKNPVLQNDSETFEDLRSIFIKVAKPHLENITQDETTALKQFRQETANISTANEAVQILKEKFPNLYSEEVKLVEVIKAEIDSLGVEKSENIRNVVLKEVFRTSLQENRSFDTLLVAAFTKFQFEKILMDEENEVKGVVPINQNQQVDNETFEAFKNILGNVITTHMESITQDEVKIMKQLEIDSRKITDTDDFIQLLRKKYPSVYSTGLRLVETAKAKIYALGPEKATKIKNYILVIPRNFHVKLPVIDAMILSSIIKYELFYYQLE